MSYYRRPREHWEREISALPVGLQQAIASAIRIGKEVTRFRYGLIDLPELKRRLRLIKKP